jgi:glutamate synthase (NADPH/NADH) small chain
MPGSAREVGYSREEGVRFLFNRQPVALLGSDSHVRAVHVVETELVDDGDGRPRPRNVPGSEIELPADVVIQAFGFRASPPAWCTEHGIALDRHGRIVTGGEGRLPLQTSHARVFAGGDNVRGADLVVRAVYDGREAAASIVHMLSTAATRVAVSAQVA